MCVRVIKSRHSFIVSWTSFSDVKFGTRDLFLIFIIYIESYVELFSSDVNTQYIIYDFLLFYIAPTRNDDDWMGSFT